MFGITRVQDGKWLFGVCNGIAKRIGWNPLWVRIIWLVLGAAGSVGFWLYIAAIFIFPKE
ncbi:MAG: PspC domain-containing protein [Eubacteriales bacterium]